MQMTYRGAHYTLNTPATQTADSPVQSPAKNPVLGKYRGQPIRIRQSGITHTKRGVELTYRGQRYAI